MYIAVVLGIGSGQAWADEAKFARFKTAPQKKPFFGKELDVGLTAALTSQHHHVAFDAVWTIDSQKVIKGIVHVRAGGGGYYGYSMLFEYKPWETFTIRVQLDYREFTERSDLAAVLSTQLWTAHKRSHTSITLDYRMPVYGREDEKLLLRFLNKF